MIDYKTLLARRDARIKEIEILNERVYSGILVEAKKHNIEDFDSEFNWLCRCVADARRTLKGVE